MALEALAADLPAYAGDLAANLASALADASLSDQQRWGCLVAASHAVATPAVIQAIEAAATEAGLAAEALTAAKGAAAIMAQNNIYFRALTLLTNPEYRALRSGLRMRIVSHPGAPRDDFDLWCVAVSAIHGCPDCLNAHEAPLRSRGVAAGAVQAAIRIAAIVHALTRVLAAEAALKASPQAPGLPVST
jgi:alkyl hydroperoxide reductase subunit D